MGKINFSFLQGTSGIIELEGKKKKQSKVIFSSLVGKKCVEKIGIKKTPDIHKKKLHKFKTRLSNLGLH